MKKEDKYDLIERKFLYIGSFLNKDKAKDIATTNGGNSCEIREYGVLFLKIDGKANIVTEWEEVSGCFSVWRFLHK